MNLFCHLKIHSWDGCVCKKCGAKRNTEHPWDGCKCTKCGKKRDEQHNWDGCECKKCHKQRDEQHDWDGCKCKKCGKKRDKQHDWDGCKCKKCDAKRDKHAWKGKLKCSKCNKERFDNDILIFQTMAMIKNVAIKEQAYTQYAKELKLNDSNGPVYMACKALGLTDISARSIANENSAWQIEKGESSNYNSTSMWGSEKCIKVAILTRYL